MSMEFEKRFQFPAFLIFNFANVTMDDGSKEIWQRTDVCLHHLLMFLDF